MILNFVIAGRDTTAVTLSWFFYMMTKHPEIADKIVDELSTIVTPQGLNSSQDGKTVKAEAIEEFANLLTYETLGKLNYLHASLSETLRLYPAVSINSKEAATDDMLPDGTPVKKGSITGYVPYSMGRMRFLWGDDATEYKPERWLNGNGEYEPQSPFKFTAFQAGPRTCLGKDSAYLQMKMTAALVLRFFHLHLVPNHPVCYRTMVTLAQRYGLRVTATPRSFVDNPS
jgi:cytochrome P450